MRRPTMRSLAGGAAGIAAGILGGIVLGSVAAGGTALPPAQGPIEAAHLPPLLTMPGEPVTLRYAIVCSPREDGRPCNGSGEVYLSPGRHEPFRRLALTRGDEAANGRYFVEVPAELAVSRDGFSYYAVLRDEASGDSVAVPSGGEAAPQRSLPLRNAVEVQLGAHAFGRTRSHDARVVTAQWGSDVGEAGVAGTRELGFVGPSAFDVDGNGIVTMLDQVNGRLQRWARGVTTTTPVDVSGGLADLAVEPDGSVDVLEPPNRTTPAPMLRRFDANGALKDVRRLADRTWAKLALGPDGPVVLQEPSEQWMPASLDRAAQSRRGKPGRPLAGGRELLVQRVGSTELRLAEVAGNAALRSWRITSTTPLGEVQLVEPLGSRIVVVVKAYTEIEDEYLVLVLDRAGVVEQFALSAPQWADAAPLARFRLARSSLYRLGSTSSGAFVDRFGLEVSR
ncbi:hypothetical protein BH18ACT12_BH18ACT12_07950 [soil metagenome]